METSKKFRFNLPSRDGVDIADIDVISQNFRKIDTKVPHVNEVSPAINNKVGGNAVKLADVSPIYTLGLKVGGISYKDGDTLKSSPVTEVERWGENIWDEEWESGYINLDSGFNGADANCSRSKNYISVKPSTTYYMYNGSWRGANDARIAFYNNDKQYLSHSTNKQFTTPSSCYYLKFYWAGTKYNNDICISEKPIPEKFTIPESIQALDGYGDGINETCYNYVDFEKKQFVKRCKRVDLGTLNWTYYENRFMLANASDNYELIAAKIPYDITYSIYSINPKYKDLSWNDVITRIEDKTLSVHGGTGGGVAVYDSNYTDATAFKSAMSGVTLLYELETPEITDISNLLTDVKMPTSIYPETNLYTDNANGYLDVTYSVDTKKYIDKKFAELQALILNA